jgi:hypothetical protein
MMISLMKINNKISDNYVSLIKPNTKDIYSFSKNDLIINKYILYNDNYIQLENNINYKFISTRN